MPEKHLYEYAIIRVVPRVEKEEFINVGVVLCSIQQQYLRCIAVLNEQKLKALDPETDPETIRKHLQAFIQVCEGKNANSPISKEPIASRFRWLTAVRSSIIQTSRPHPGISPNLDETVDALLKAYVQ
ncbi:Protein of unknown function [Cyclobacterium xiamenense]|uniref:DUF3037 domain-containing protein n=1 Tax=Cyclobacterium xiamenense TaxID=1297121 RepID=A0A1H7B8K3_9BACT|nr:DUF3037 domain-containing protein [Cyclobacterium xiamenense]SEJ74121.1 Protein of unknown function [Cyclobacterium xiamenense]